jgi:hypothetical protein
MYLISRDYDRAHGLTGKGHQRTALPPAFSPDELDLLRAYANRPKRTRVPLLSKLTEILPLKLNLRRFTAH